MVTDLTGKLAIVTGGGRGLGRQVSLLLASLGAEVVLTWCDDLLSAAGTVDDINRRGGAASPLWLDLKATERMASVVETFSNSWRVLDVLVHNAGVNRPMDFADAGPDVLAEVLAVNLVGPFELTRLLLPMVRDGGSVVWVGSSSADTGGPRSVHYAASKAALAAVSRGVALAGALRGIRSNVVQPGYLASEMARAATDDEAVARTVAKIPLGRLGTFGEAAEAVAFLASPAASYVTGQVLRVDGGLVFGS